MSDETIAKLEAVWASIAELCGGLSDDQWGVATDCPGWDVKDNLSHLVGIESMLLGRPAPEHTPANTDHIRNEIGQANEIQVDVRRSKPPAEVLAEFREVTAARLEQLRGWGPDDFAKETWTPMGPGTVLDFLQIRIFDSWVHEQDIRRAVGRPGDLEGPVAEHAFGRISSAMPFVVGKKVAPPDGTTVVFEITGPAGGTIPVGVEGRAKVLDAVPADPTVTLTMDLAAFNRLGCGRGDPAEIVAEVTIAGDEDLGRRIVEQMTFMI